MKAWVLTSWLLLMFAASAQAGDELRLSFKPAASVTGSEVVLGDLIRIQTDDPQLLRGLAELPVRSSPTTGHYVPVERAEILSVIQARYPLLSSKIKWQGPDRALLRRHGQQLEPKMIEQRAEDALRNWLSARFQTFDIQPVPGQRYLAEVAESSKIAFSARDTDRPRKRMAVWCEIKEPNGHARTFPVWFSVAVTGEVWMAEEDIAEGKLLQDAPLHLQTVDIAALHTPPVRSDEVFQNVVSRVSLRAGTVLLQDQIKKRPEVSTGETVRVELKDQGLFIQTAGVALQNATTGDVVHVRSGSGAMLLATVTGRGVVEVSQ